MRTFFIPHMFSKFLPLKLILHKFFNYKYNFLTFKEIKTVLDAIYIQYLGTWIQCIFARIWSKKELNPAFKMNFMKYSILELPAVINIRFSHDPAI